MRRTLLGLAVLTFLPAMAAGGEIFGTIKEGGKTAGGLRPAIRAVKR